MLTLSTKARIQGVRRSQKRIAKRYKYIFKRFGRKK